MASRHGCVVPCLTQQPLGDLFILVVLAPIALHRGETPEQVANEYCDRHGLDKETVVPQVAKLLGDMLEKALATEAAGAA